MATTVTSTTLTVPELRERWLPHKERFSRAGSGHPTAVRFHRACSWLEETQQLDPVEQADQILIYQWTAFNALYGQWDLNRHESLADRESWQVFLTRMLDLDETRHLVSLLNENRGLVLAIVGNAYLSKYFWQLTVVWRQLAYGHRLPGADTVRGLCAEWNQELANED